ncbi:uncharacterized protein LOC141621770 [Silene latifolia]|uniref:uncharacterized protein LOC141621770 n=1 Tax=Silene latifolia TaxID=37657 RepID=UPI003D770914
MGRKKMANRTPPKRGPKKGTNATAEEVSLRSKATGRKKFMVKESVDEDVEMEEAVVTKRRGPNVVLGKRKGVVIEDEVGESEIEDSESEGVQPPPTVAEKKGKGKRQKPLANEGKSNQPKAPECVKPVSEVGECSNRMKSQIIVRLKKPVQEIMDEEIADVNRPVEKEKEVEDHGNTRALFELIQVLTPTQKKCVEDIGFGGLLELKANAFYHFMADWLMECYDNHSQMFMFSEKTNFVITKHDVYDVFMQPCTDGDVLVTSSKIRTTQIGS